MFENVTYEFYTGTLGRSVIPDAAAFDKYTLENKQIIKSLAADGLIAEREENGIDSAVCMMCEIDYTAEQTMSGAGDSEETAPLSSESIQGYSYAFDNTQRNKAIELNAESVKAQKMKWIKLFCDVFNGWRI